MNSEKKGDYRQIDAQRYLGHLSLCELDYPGQLAIHNGKVLIIGVGGLGSPLALYLTAAGVGTIGIVDADKVALSNLQRQIIHSTQDVGRLKVESAFDSMKNLNPEVKVNAYPVMLSELNAPQILQDYDIVADCTDSFETRIMVSTLCEKAGKPYVFGSVARFSGQAFTYVPGSMGFRDFFGSESPGACEGSCAMNGILNTVVGVVGCIQSTEILKYLAGVGELLIDRLLTFDLLTMTFNVYTTCK